MLTGRPKPTLELTVDERTQLKSLAASRTLPHALVCRAKVVLWSAKGQSNTGIADRLGWTKGTVGKWRQRFLEHRLAGLYDELRSGRPRSIEDEQIAALLKRTLSRKAAGGTHWSVRHSGAKEVHRINPQDTLEDIMARSKDLGAEAIIETVRLVEAGNYALIPNDASQATHFSMPTKADMRRFVAQGRRFR